MAAAAASENDIVAREVAAAKEAMWSEFAELDLDALTPIEALERLLHMQTTVNELNERDAAAKQLVAVRVAKAKGKQPATAAPKAKAPAKAAPKAKPAPKARSPAKAKARSKAKPKPKAKARPKATRAKAVSKAAATAAASKRGVKRKQKSRTLQRTLQGMKRQQKRLLATGTVNSTATVRGKRRQNKPSSL